MKCYDWKKNILSFKDKYDNIFYLELRGDKQVICGDSGSGKTLLCNKLMQSSRDRNKKYRLYDTDNIMLVTQDNVDRISAQYRKLIIVDRADILLQAQDIDRINLDHGKNRYLLMSRYLPGLELSPNYYAHLIEKDKRFTLEYLFSIGGWF